MKKGFLFLIIFAFSFCLLSCGNDSTHDVSSEWEKDNYYHWHSCGDCSKLFDKELHTWNEGVITKEPTEEVDGVKTYTCTVCSATKVEVIYALGHVHEFSNEYSHDELFHWFASTCGHNDEVGNKELHEYEFKQLTAATCTEDEVLIGTCVCGDTMIKVGELAKGHQVDNYVSNNDATCLANGTKTGDCTVCGDVCTVIDEGSMLEHYWNEVTVPASYEASGETYRECLNDYCGKKETLEIHPQLISVSEVELSGDSFMVVNSTQSLAVNVFPLDAHDKTLSWHSSDETVVSVDENGDVSALKTGRATITATSHNGIERDINILVLETAVDAQEDNFYDGVVAFSGRRSDPILTHKSYVKLSKDGVYIYEIVTDGSGKTGTAHVEWYFTLGDEVVSDGSLAIHVYYESAPRIRTYTYSSTTNVARNDNLATQYCDYEVRLISDENGIATYAYEIFVDYSYFGLTVAPESIKAQARVVSGGGNPLINSIATSGCDYKDINNYEEYSEKGYSAEIVVDGEKDEKYDGLVAFSGSRVGPIVAHESYVKLGEEGIYVYQIVKDGSGKTEKSHVEWYFTLGEEMVLDDSFSIHVYYNVAPNIRTYTYSSTTNTARNDSLAISYCNYAVNLIGEENGVATYAYELFVSYDYFGLEEAPESIKAQVRTISGGGNPLINSAATTGLDYKEIESYETFDKNGYYDDKSVDGVVIDGEKDEIYDSLVNATGQRENPTVTHDTTIYLGTKGIYVYQVIEDGSGLDAIKSHVELYFTTGTTAVLDDSLSVHIYPTSSDTIRTYKYSSTSNVVRDNSISQNYCDYSVKILANETGYGKYVVELFVDYTYFGLTEAPESIKVQVRAQSGGGNPMTNTVAGGLDYKDIANYYTVDANGIVTDKPEEVVKEVIVDGNKDEKYNSVFPLIGKRTDPVVTQEVYVYFGEDGIYAYQLVTDGSGKTAEAHVEWYFTLGDTSVEDDSLSVHLYYEKEPYIRSYKYSSTSNVSRDDNIAKAYCDYSIKLISNEGGIAMYAYELFIDYSYFKATTTPESMKIQVRASSGGKNPLTNSVHAGTLDYKVIDNYYTFDEKGLVYSNVGIQDLQLDPTNLVSGYYETEFTLQTLNTLNKLSNATFTGVGSEYIKEVGNGRYKLSIPVDKVADFVEKQKITVVDVRNIGATFNIQILEEAKEEFKLLMIGNSFSDDTIQWVHEICADLGIDFTVANLYIGGASLATHLSNLTNDTPSYTYREYDKINKIWVSHNNVSISEALTFDNWNYISLQQGSAVSGKADSYDDIDKIIGKILTIKDNVKFIWNMTWAYQQDSTHSSFVNYDSNQETMYNAIVDAVETKILTNDRISLISPAGTAIQNARTSFIGDTLTRDGHHLSYELGRYIAGLTLVGTLTKADLTKVKYSPNLTDKHRDMAIESAINAINNPFAVTESTYKDDVEKEHDWVTKVVEATCVSEGERYQECSYCGEKVVLEVLPKKLLEATVDAEKDELYESLTSVSGERTNPLVSHESYIYVGENGIYVYQIIEDGKGLNETASHVELYFTIGNEVVADNSLSVHIYPLSVSDPIRSYTYSSTVNTTRNDNLAKTYCIHSTKVITNESEYGKYVVELFVDYSYFGLTEAPETIKVQARAISGAKNPLTNNTAGGLDYKLIENYYTFDKNGLVVEEDIEEINVDAEKDELYESLTPVIGERTNPLVSHETYVYLGEKGIYVYQIIEDGKGLNETASHVELYFTIGNELVSDNSLSVHIYPLSVSDSIRSYTYSSTTNVSRDDNLAKTYCTHSIKVITDESGYGKYVVELFVDYSYFGLTEAPETIKVQVRAVSGAKNPLTNNTAGGLDYKLIENYYTFGKNGLVE